MASAAVEKLRSQLKSTRRNSREAIEEAKGKFLTFGLGSAAVGGYIDETYPEAEFFGVSGSEALGAVALIAGLTDFAGDYDIEAVASGVGLLAPQANEFGRDFARKRKK